MNNSIITSQENKVLTAGMSADGVADADTPRKVLVSAWSDFVFSLADWESMLTLTVSNEKMCFKDGLVKRARSLIQILNRDLYGDNYYRIVKHSYFSYAMGLEYTKNTVNHLHIVVDMPINFSLVHTLWNHMSGFAYIKPVPDRRGAADYICKYVVKGQELTFWKQEKKDLPCPKFVPIWYSNNLPDGHSHKDFFLSHVK
jgi:hypothetical protein